MKIKTLCQDCAAVVVVDEYELLAAEWSNWNGNCMCKCGGDVCGCAGCLHVIEAGIVAQVREK